MQKWELREQFDKQDEQFQAIRERYDRAVIESGTRLADLKAEQEALLRKEFQTGADLSADKAKVRGKIADAEKALAAAELERTQAHDYARTAAADDRITVRHLVIDWNGPYRQAVRQAELQPIIDRMAAARESYFNALLDFKLLQDRYRYAYSELRDMAHVDNRNHPGNMMMPNEIAQYRDLPQITSADLLNVDDRHQLPAGIKRVPTGGEA
ncbi:hypothetical protein [Paenibacillus naphthalenovorans]|uniref:hypothetical protein n=1 Tax=Paenibacillus naphthalenovorans TaxID=162209 RepID=UPI003D2BCEE4